MSAARHIQLKLPVVIVVEEPGGGKRAEIESQTLELVAEGPGDPLGVNGCDRHGRMFFIPWARIYSMYSVSGITQGDDNGRKPDKENLQ